MSGHLVLDMSRARRTRNDDIVGVSASVGERTETVMFTADACVAVANQDDGMACEGACISAHQAWLAVFLITGRQSMTPIGDGDWDAERRTITFHLRSGRRSAMG